MLEFEDEAFVHPLFSDGSHVDEIIFPRLEGLLFWHDSSLGVYRNGANPHEILIAANTCKLWVCYNINLF